MPFKLNRAQNYYWERKTRRNLILKGRQGGLTKIIDADQLVDCFRKSTNAVVISHEKEATERLFSSVRYYVENMKIKPQVSIDSAHQMKFPKRGSSYFIGTAGQRAFGRGDTIDRAHLSEAAFYQDFKKILAGISEAAEYGQIDIETTPNGRDDFYDMWQQAKQGQSAYTCIFIPWFIMDGYNADDMTPAERQGLSAAVRELFDTPDEQIILTPDEARLIERVEQEYGFTMTMGQIKWRRYKIWDKGNLFFQEYPEDDVSCFLQTGRSVMTNIVRDSTKKIPLDNFDTWGTEEDRRALKARTLYAGVDCAEGVAGGDSHVFSVIDAPANRKDAHVIYEYASTEPIDVFWSKIIPIIKTFRLHLGVEKNGVGVAHVKHARERGINFTQWDTTGANRPSMISELEEAYRKEELIETYAEAENECRDMIYTTTNRAEAQKGKHDDRVMSRAIAWQMRKRPMPSVSIM